MEDWGFDYDSMSEQTRRDMQAPYRMSRAERQERLLIVLMCMVALFSLAFMAVVINRIAVVQQHAASMQKEADARRDADLRRVPETKRSGE